MVYFTSKHWPFFMDCLYSYSDFGCFWMKFSSLYPYPRLSFHTCVLCWLCMRSRWSYNIYSIFKQVCLQCCIMYCCQQIDSKFTTTTQIVKLVGSHTISKITLRIGDLKRTKMVRTINIYYNNRSVQAVVELKNKPGKHGKYIISCILIKPWETENQNE